MNDNTPPTDTDISLARKRLAQELRICIIGQTIGLFALITDIVLGAGNVGDTVFFTPGLTFSIFVAFVGLRKLVGVAFIPNRITNYAHGGFCLYAFIFVFSIFLGFFLRLELSTIDPILITLYIGALLYCIIPQYFIARWLARQAEEGTMEAVEDNPPV